MSVSSVNAGNSVGASQFQNRGQGPGAAFRQLVQGIKSGNLDAAQSAYDSLTSQLPDSSQSSSSTTTSTQTSFQQFLQQVGSDLQNGDIQGAQQALSSLEQTAQSGKVGGHHHHHGGGGGGQIQASTTAISADAAPSGSTTSSILSGVNLTV